jgi:hypothetical protein
MVTEAHLFQDFGEGFKVGVARERRALDVGREQLREVREEGLEAR